MSFQKKLFSQFILSLLLASNSFSAEVQLTSVEKDYLTERGSITMCVDPAWEPMERINKEGHHIGIAADYIALLKKKLGIEIQLIPTDTWAESMKGAQERTCDILSLAAKTPDRSEYMLFTPPYITLHNALVAKNDKSFVKDIGTILDKKIGVVKGYAAEELLRKRYPNINLVPVKSPQDGLLQVSSGKIDYMNDYISSASFYISKLALSQIRIVGTTDIIIPLSIAVRSDQPILKDILSKGVASISQMEVDQISQKWVSVEVAEKTNVSMIINIIIGLGIISLLIFIWNLTLRRSVRNRTKELEESEHYNRMLFETSKMGLALCRFDGTLVDINPAYSDLLGRTKEETINLTYWDITPKSYEAQEGEQLKSLETTGSYGPYEKEYIHKDGHLVPVRLQGQIIEKEGEKYIWSSVENITETKKMSDELKNANISLEKKVQERTVELSNALEKADKANKAKTLFLTTMSHELRTPLNGLIGPFHMLQEYNNYEKEQLELLDIVEASTSQMYNIINDILDFTKIESGKLHIENVAFEVEELIANVTRIAKPLAKNKDIAYDCVIDKDIPLNLLGDPTRINQILMNLISNAIKFTNDGSVSLRVERYEVNSKPFVEFIVTDTGIGIPKEKKENIFAAFTQADSSTTRLFGGSGLGLSIVKRLVDLQGGIIEFKSTLGKGSEFRVSLPMVEVKPAKKTKEIGDSEPNLQKALNVLVVEDNLINQKLAQKMLESLGHKVVIANNGKEALDKIHSEKFDFVLMDWLMPIMDGLEATKKIRELGGEFAEMPIIGLTANAYNEDRITCFEAGMNEVLAKPITKNHLQKAIKTFF